jgi:hypothetical protein
VLIATQQESKAQEKFSGVPRDIDFIKNAGWSQVILQGKGPTDSLIAQTKNERIVRVLLVALSLKAEATVQHVDDGTNPKKLTVVTLIPKIKAEEGHVLAISFAEIDGYYRATIIKNAKEEKVWTKSAQMQSILEGAVRQALPVQEFAFDAETREITRGKLNIELPLPR